MVRKRKSIIALTKREKEILTLVAQGFSDNYIANKLYLAEQTINNYLQKIYEKFFIEKGKKYNRRVRAVYLLIKTERLSFGYKILEQSIKIQKDIQAFEQWLQAESEEV